MPEYEHELTMTHTIYIHSNMEGWMVVVCISWALWLADQSRFPFIPTNPTPRTNRKYNKRTKPPAKRHTNLGRHLER